MKRKKLGYNIFPQHGSVYAEIYKLFDSRVVVSKEVLQMRLISKYFGKWYRQPIEQDYIDAKNWCEKHIQYILTANNLKNEE